MTSRFDVEMVSTGAELLNGRSVNTHARMLGGRLEEMGFRLARETTVGDAEADIADAVRSAMSRAGIILVSGGLGPTCDDVTREAVAGLLGRRLVTDAGSLEALRERYARAGRELTDSRRRQALVLEGAVALANRTGAAPGERIEAGEHVIFLLPGPPNEFSAIFEDHVAPWLRARFPDARPPALAVLQLCGIAESDAVERLAAAGFDAGPLELAYCASPGNLEVRLRGAPELTALAAAKTAELRAIFGADIYSESREDLAAVVGRMLQAAGATVAVAESCTGGGIGRRLTSVAGSSAWFRGGAIAYSNEIKTGWLDVPAELIAREGAVSEAVARRMAEGVRARAGADYGVATTGIAGPGGGSAEKPVGLVFIACADATQCAVLRRQFMGDRETVRRWTEQYALDLLRRRVRSRSP